MAYQILEHKGKIGIYGPKAQNGSFQTKSESCLGQGSHDICRICLQHDIKQHIMTRGTYCFNEIKGSAGWDSMRLPKN